MKIIICGGHLSPALAVIEKLKNEQVYYVGRKYALEGDSANSLEFTEISKLNIPFYEIKTGRIQRTFTKYTFPSLLKFPSGFLQAYKILKSVSPDVVLGFGGYVSVPIVLCAKLLNIPAVLHEQTLEVGLANKLLGKIVDKVCISWQSSAKFFPKEKTTLTGIPLRSEIYKLKEGKTNVNTIYITGGSLGSHFINQLVGKNLKELLKDYNIIHQTGDSRNFNDFDNLLKIKQSLANDLAKNYKLTKFLTPTVALKSLAQAEIIVSRAGINTVSELIYLHKPSYLIPIPFSQRNEQLKNANFAKSLGLSEVGNQQSLTPQEFLKTIRNMFANLSKYKITDKIFMDETSAEKIINTLVDVSKKKKNK